MSSLTGKKKEEFGPNSTFLRVIIHKAAKNPFIFVAIK